MTTEKMARPGKTETHHCWISERPSETMAPHSGAGGTTPRPRKPRPAKVISALPTSRVTSVVRGPRVLGMIWRSTMRDGLKPMTRAASTYSRERWTRTRLRLTRAYFGHQTTTMAMMVLVQPTPSAAAIAMARMRGGKQRKRSVTRIMASSIFPPTKAATAP